MQNHKILKVAIPHPHIQNAFHKELGISKVLAQVLANRGVTNIKEAEKFLNVKLEHLLNPNLFSDMPKAVGLIKKAAQAKERVMVFGDYDADGITALALLKGTLQKLGIDVLHYLPNRLTQGYGLTKGIAEFLKKNSVKLLITVDCGITNYKEIEELRRNNIEVIVTDHHEPQADIMPPASCIINPKVKNSGYKFRELAGVGVAYKLCQALTGSTLSEELDLVSLGTIADSVPLMGENRVIAKEGLSYLPNTRKAGLQVLMDNAGIRNKKFTSTFVSFILAPRINACGRMDTAEVSLSLLMSENTEEAIGLAKIVESHNRQRQKIEGKILQEAEDLINKEVNFKEHKVIVIAKEDWHHGVLGIVASKIADRFYRPAIVISLSDNICKGSGRSIKNFHLFEALLECKDLLDSFGGHAHAVGLVITRDSINDFRRNINRLAHEKLSIEDLLPGLDIDMELPLEQVSEDLARELESLEPYGAGNPEPLFYTRGLKLKGEPQVLSRETLKFWVSDGMFTIQAIGFGMSSFNESLKNASSLDLVYTPKIDNWRDEPSLILEARNIFFK
ncbi:MAG: single-stranded-DNA-specific exonuclease RecJ [Candidatus Omnitrophota bacterium]|jgi:single-stranded-DNA-specific exonuclease